RRTGVEKDAGRSGEESIERKSILAFFLSKIKAKKGGSLDLSDNGGRELGLQEEVIGSIIAGTWNVVEVMADVCMRCLVLSVLDSGISAFGGWMWSTYVPEQCPRVNIILVGMWSTYVPEQCPITFSSLMSFRLPMTLFLFLVLYLESAQITWKGKMIGMEYLLSEVMESHMFVIQKQKQESLEKSSPMLAYYILDGYIYQAPQLCNVFASLIV
ncbi:hypothetical protein ACJX0J_021535, partial [Zea mays]